MKKCCEKFKKGECNNSHCPFPHVEEATKEAKKITAADKIVEKLKVEKSKRGPTAAIERGRRDLLIVDEKYDKTLLRQNFFSQHRVLGYDSSNNWVQECKVCGKEFSMNEREIRWFKDRMLTMPKTCKDCRMKGKV